MSIIEIDPGLFGALDDADWSLLALAGELPDEATAALAAGMLPVAAATAEVGDAATDFEPWVLTPCVRDGAHACPSTCVDREQAIAGSVAGGF